MLQTIHDKVSGWLAAIVLGVIAIVFVFWGVSVREGTSVSSYAAEVNGEKIPLETARRAWQERQTRLQQMMRSELPAEFMKSQQRSLLDELIRSRMLAAHAQDSGYRVTDVAIAETIMSAEPLQVDGKFSRDRYAALLRQQGRTEAQFEQELRSDLEIGQLQSGIASSAFAAPFEIKRAQALQNEQREIDYAVIPLTAFKDSAAVTDAQIQAWYDAHKSAYQTAEMADFEYLLLTLDDAAKDVKVTDEELKAFYEQNKERYEAPERRHAHHILIAAADGVDDAAAHKTADAVFAKAKAGEDFAALAKQYSKDPGSAQQGGDLGWAGRGMFVGPFEDALFSMSVGEIRGPVKTQFGYHVIKLDEIDKPHSKTLEEARPELEAEYRRDRAQSIFYERSQKLADQSFAALTELQSVAKSLGLQTQQVHNFTRQGGGEGAASLGDSREVIDAVFSDDVAEKRHNSPMIAIGDDKAVVLRVTNHRSPEQKPLAQVRADIEAQLKTQAQRLAAAKQGNEALQQLEKGGTWNSVIADLKVQPTGKRFIGRKESSIAAPALRLAFGVPRAAVSDTHPVYRGLELDNGDYALIAVSAVRSGDSAPSAAQGKAGEQSLVREGGAAEFSAYIKQLESSAKIKRNPAVFE